MLAVCTARLAGGSNPKVSHPKIQFRSIAVVVVAAITAIVVAPLVDIDMFELATIAKPTASWPVVIPTDGHVLQ
jgi:hypothetical protein